MRLDPPLLAGDPIGQPAAFFGFEPMRLLGPIGQIEKHRDADQHRRNGLQDVHHLPSFEAP